MAPVLRIIGGRWEMLTRQLCQEVATVAMATHRSGGI